MKTYCSYGGGVNSTAMIIYLLEAGTHIDSIVFADTGGEWPETYEYIDYFEEEFLSAHDLRIERVSAVEMGLEVGNVWEFFVASNFLPSRIYRLCTQRWKVYPIHQHFERPCIDFIGYTTNEYHRMEATKERIEHGVHKMFPLIKAGMTRNYCIDLIRKTGLKVPQKSGCWFCPFMNQARLSLLFRRHPDLFQKLKDLEESHNEGKDFKYYIYGKSLTEYEHIFDLQARQLSIYDRIEGDRKFGD